MERLWLHMRRLWPRWPLLPAAPFVLWSLLTFVRGELRWEAFLILFFVPAIAYGNEKTKGVYKALLPFGLVGLLYDSMRFVKNLGLDSSTIHVCDLRDLELSLFGVRAGGARITLNDFFHAHHTLALDLFCAIPYGVYLFVPMAYAVWLYRKDAAAMQRFGYTFLVLNVAGFVTYHLYPAAPPWYFHANGCSVDVAAHASEGAALARVDQLLGVRYFAGLYGRSSDVFGAVPSLHVAYPLLMTIEGWSKHRSLGRGALVFYWLWTCFAAVYLDHHWVFDVALGLLYTCAIHFTLRRVFALAPSAQAQPSTRAVAAEAISRR